MQLPLFEVLVQARLTMVNCGNPKERSAANGVEEPHVLMDWKWHRDLHLSKLTKCPLCACTLLIMICELCTSIK